MTLFSWQDHRELGVVVQEVRDKLQQRLKDLQRAQQTATSDPTAKEDITDVGDMEIESDTESQEGVVDVAMAPVQSVKRPPPAVNQPHPPANQPRPPQQPIPPAAVLPVPGGFVNSQPPSLFQGPVYSQQQPPLSMRAPPPTGASFQPRPPPNSFQPAMVRPQGMQRPPPTSQPPPRFPSAPRLMMPTPRPRGLLPMQQAVRPQLLQGGVRTPQIRGGVRPPQMQGPSQIPVGARPPQVQGPSQIPVGARPPQVQGPSQIQGGARPPRMQVPQGSVRPPQMQGGIRPPQIQGGVRPPRMQSGLSPLLQVNVLRTLPSNTVYQTSTSPVMYTSAGPTPGNSVTPSSAAGMQAPATSAVGTPSQPPVSAGRLPITAVPSEAQLAGPAGKPAQLPIPVGTQQQPHPLLSAPAILVSQSGGEGPATSPTGNPPSLDERLKSLLAHKTFTKSLLPDYPDSGSEDAGSRPYSPSTTLNDKDKPYSPSANDLIISNTGSPLEVDNDSVPSPPTEGATPEDASPSPQLNMNNPILKALYQHESEEGLKEHPVTPNPVTADPVPSQPPAPSPQASSQKAAGSGPSLLSAVDTGLLQSILTNVSKSVSKTATAVARDRMAPSQPVVPPHTPEPISLQSERQTSPAPVSVPKPPPAKTPPNPSAPLQPKSTGVSVKDIKITPTLTSLLDEIFPKLSRSLQERKRKPGDPEPSTPESPLPGAKAPRLDPSSEGALIPRGPPMRQPPPTAGTRPSFPPPTSAGPPLRPQFAPRAPGVPMGPRGPRQLRPLLQQPPGRPPNAGQWPQNRPPFFARPQIRPERPPFQPNPNHIDHFAPKHPEEFSQVGMNFRPPLSQTSPIRNFDSVPHPLRPPGPNFRAPLRPRFM